MSRDLTKKESEWITTVNCFNCTHYNHNQIQDLPMPCKFRKNMCFDSDNCKHFKFLDNIGEIFQTQMCLWEHYVYHAESVWLNRE
jgi:hypothetical protein